MIKYIIVILIVLIGSGSILSQNLIPNHDFSQINANCDPDSFFAGDKYVKKWFGVPNNSQLAIGSQVQSFDLIHNCKKNSNAPWAWPSEYPGFDWDVSDMFECDTFDYHDRPEVVEGDGYASIRLADTFYTSFNYRFVRDGCNNTLKVKIQDTITRFGRGFMQVKLSQPLKRDEEYVLEFYIHPILIKRVQNHLIPHLGLHLSQDTFKPKRVFEQNFRPTFETSKFYKQSKWYRIQAEVKANGGEQFLTIGNFRRANNTTVQQNGCQPGCTGLAAGPVMMPPQIYVDAVYLFKTTDSLFNVYIDAPNFKCPDEEITLTVKDTGFKLNVESKKYLWNTGDTTKSIKVQNPGTYRVRVTYNNRWWDTARVVVKDYKPYRSGLPDTVQGCLERQTVVKANLPESYHSLRWSTGQGTPTIPAPSKGSYWLTASWPCGKVTDTVFVQQDSCSKRFQKPEFYVPDAFTPNGDGLNDTWDIYKLPKQNEVWVFNRWGERVFHAKNYRGNWDGTDTRGNKLPPGVYAYRIQYTYPPNITDEKKGSLTIMRRRR